MKNLNFLLILFLTLFFASTIYAQEYEKLTDFIGQSGPFDLASDNDNNQQIENSYLALNGVSFFNDRFLFEAESCNFEVEDFENPAVIGINGCDGPLTNMPGSCYSSVNTLMLSYLADAVTNNGPGSQGLVTVSPPQFNSPSNSVAPNFFADTWIINFSDNDVYSVGWDHHDQVNVSLGIGFATYTVNVYTTGDVLIGSTTFTGNGASQFFGVVSSSVVITKIEYGNFGGSALEFIDNFTLGTSCIPIPTLSQWGIIALSMLTMIFGVVMIRQRKTIFA